MKNRSNEALLRYTNKASISRRVNSHLYKYSLIVKMCLGR